MLGVVCAARSATSSVVSLWFSVHISTCESLFFEKTTRFFGGSDGVEVGFTGNYAMLCGSFHAAKELTKMTYAKCSLI